MNTNSATLQDMEQMDAQAGNVVVQLLSRGSVCLQNGDIYTEQEKAADLAYLSQYKSKYSKR